MHVCIIYAHMHRIHTNTVQFTTEKLLKTRKLTLNYLENANKGRHPMHNAAVNVHMLYIYVRMFYSQNLKRGQAAQSVAVNRSDTSRNGPGSYVFVLNLKSCL
jgi:hypothetical protein